MKKRTETYIELNGEAREDTVYFMNNALRDFMAKRGIKTMGMFKKISIERRKDLVGTYLKETRRASQTPGQRAYIEDVLNQIVDEMEPVQE